MFNKLKNKIVHNFSREVAVKKKGFTIVEMIVAVGIFAVVMVLAVGALLTIVAANKTAQAMKVVMNNVNYAVEDMVRTIRSGSNYSCDVSPCSSLSLSDNDGESVFYGLSGSILMRNGQALTSNEVEIDRLSFHVWGTEADDDEQPTVLILIGGKVRLKNNIVTRFDIETMAVQRLFNK